MKRYLSCFWGAWAAVMIARAAGLPLWIDWPSDLSMTDATDVGVLVFLCLTGLTGPTPVQVEKTQ